MQIFFITKQVWVLVGFLAFEFVFQIFLGGCCFLHSLTKPLKELNPALNKLVEKCARVMEYRKDL